MDLNRELRNIDRDCKEPRFSMDEYRWVEMHDADKRRELIKSMILRKRRIEATPPADLEYEEFLDSEYWRWLSTLMKCRAMYRCQDCGFMGFPAGTGLEVHHKTYAHRGKEYPDHLEDLIVLCRTCHSKRHGK